MNWTAVIPGPSMLYRIAAYVALAASLAGTYAVFIHHERQIGRDEVHAEWNASKGVQATAALKEAAKNAAETQRRLAAQQEAQHAHDEELARARADAAIAAAASGRLSRQLAAFTAAARRAASDPAAVANSEATGSPVDLLADVFSGANSVAGVLGEALDAAHAAGVQCERDYDALTGKP